MTDQFAAHLRQAAPFVHAHKGRTAVVYLPGEAAQRPDFSSLLFDLALAHGLGLRLVLVLGARPQIAERLAAAGLQGTLQGDLRVTDAASLQCVKEVAGALRAEVEALLSTALASTPLGGRRVQVVSGNLVTARPCGVRDGTDMQYTGEVRRIASDEIHAHLDAARIVLLPCLGTSPTGESFNLRSEDLAVRTAASLQADKLMLYCPQEINSGECTPAALAEWPGLPAAERAMAAAACAAKVPKVHVLPLDRPGVLLTELYTHTGGGLLVSGAARDQIREASIDDIGGLLQLIAPLEAEGTLVPRSREQLELDIRHFALMQHDGACIGCRALLPLDDGRSAELACLVVHPDWRGHGRASALLHHAEGKARETGIDRLYVLTTRTTHWFVEQGFTQVEPQSLPAERHELYNWQRASQVLLKQL